MNRRLPPLLLSALSALPIACAPRPEKSTENAPRKPVVCETVRTGSVVAVLLLDRTNAVVSDVLRLVAEVRAPAGTTVELPQPANDAFLPLDVYDEPVQTAGSGKLRFRRVWRIAPGAPGTNHLSLTEIHADDLRLRLPPVRIVVRSLLPPDADPSELRDLAPPVRQLPVQRARRRGAATLLLFAILSLILFRRWHRRRNPIPPLPPERVAAQALDRLPELPRERLHALVRILRRYLEARYGRPVPGRSAGELRANGLADRLGDDVIDFLERHESPRFDVAEPSAELLRDAERFVRDVVDRPAADEREEALP